MIPFVPIAAALGSALNFFSQQKNMNTQAKVSRENTDKTIAANRATADTAYQRDLAQWNRSNAYNSPMEQMKRLKEAGLNPMMAYGSGSVAGNTSGQSPTMGQPQADYQYAPQQMASPDILGPMQAVQQYQLTKAQTANVETQTSATQQKINNDIVQNTLLQIDKQLKEENLKTEKTKNLYLEKEKLLDMLIKNTENAARSQAIDQQGQLFPYQLDFQKGSLETQKNQNKKLLSDIKLQGFQGLKTIQETKNVEQTTKNLTAQESLLKLQKELSDQDLLEKKYNNWLREKGYDPGSNPMQFGTKIFATFLKSLVN